MLFVSRGYESDGVAAVPIDPKTQRLLPEGLEAVGYGGC